MTSVSAFADLLARYAKISAAVVGVGYGIGFLVTASRMAEYDIPVNTLISAQYLMAGPVPLLLLLRTSDYYVVTPSQPPDQPVWTLAADAVYGITRVK